MSIPAIGASAPSVSASPEIQIEAATGYSWFAGTSEQLIAEGLIPPGFVWPVGLEVARWTAGQISYSLFRRSPAKGVPKAVWRHGDFWGLAGVIAGASPRVMECRRALQKALRANSPEGWAESERFCDARRDERFCAFRDALFPRTRRG